MKKLIQLLLILLLTDSARSQVIMHLQLPAAGLTVREQLWNLLLVNSGINSEYVRIEVQFTDAITNQRVFTAVSRPVVLTKGPRQIRISDVSPVQYNTLTAAYSSSSMADAFLPVGTFHICYNVVHADGHTQDIISDECETVTIDPLSPPSLISPADNESLNESRPSFTWMPPAPMSSFTRLVYDLNVVEVYPTQTSSDAIQKNLPVLTVSSVSTTNLPYPAASLDLDTAKLYAWQIKARSNYMPIGSSEIWTFKVHKDQVHDSLTNSLYSFTKLSRSSNPALVRSGRVLHFEYFHDVNDPDILINIYDVTKGQRVLVPGERTTNALRSGVNFLELDLTKESSFVEGNIYLLELTNSRKENWYLRFKL